MILLGAGASVEAGKNVEAGKKGLPTAKELTKELINHFSDESQEKSILQRVLSRIKEDGEKVDDIDVERLLNAVELITDLHTLGLNKLVSVWNPKTDKIGPAQEEVPRQLRNLVMKSKDYLKQRLWCSDNTDLSYLNPLAEFLKQQVEQQGTTTVATLNYDNVVELLCRQHGILCSYGLDGYEGSFQVKPPKKGVHLIKLHGSLNWCLMDTYEMGPSISRFEILEWGNLRCTRNEIHQYGNTAIIFGQRNKLSPVGPFLDLYHTFRDELFKREELTGALLTEKLTIIGYSFGDPHINFLIERWVDEGHTCTLNHIDPHADTLLNPDFTSSTVGDTVQRNKNSYLHLTHNRIPNGTGEGLKDARVFGEV